jgi:hypothetical protein
MSCVFEEATDDGARQLQVHYDTDNDVWMLASDDESLRLEQGEARLTTAAGGTSLRADASIPPALLRLLDSSWLAQRVPSLPLTPSDDGRRWEAEMGLDADVVQVVIDAATSVVLLLATPQRRLLLSDFRVTRPGAVPRHERGRSRATSADQRAGIAWVTQNADLETLRDSYGVHREIAIGGFTLVWEYGPRDVSIHAALHWARARSRVVVVRAGADTIVDYSAGVEQPAWAQLPEWQDGCQER